LVGGTGHLLIFLNRWGEEFKEFEEFRSSGVQGFGGSGEGFKGGVQGRGSGVQGVEKRDGGLALIQPGGGTAP
jgi:hypothetical protein